MSTVLPDLLDPAVRRDPYPFYRALQEQAPVYHCEQWGWLVSRYADVAAALHEPALSAAGTVEALFESLPAEMQETLGALKRHLSLWLGNRCPVDHAALAARFRPPFHMTAVRPFRAVTGDLAAAMLQPVRARASFDLVADFAGPLPAHVIARVIGADRGDQERFPAWSATLTEFLGFGLMDPAVQRRAQATVIEMTECLGRALDARSGDRHEDGDLLSLGAAWIAAGDMTRDAFLANCVLLLFAGHETTTIAIGNTLLLLLSDPAAAARAATDASYRAACVQESLRFESPVQMIRRRAEADVVVGGTRIRHGDFVWLMLGAANRDPRAFEDSDQFRPGRAGRKHLAFGHGPHYCLGASLSVIEAEEAVRAFLSAVPAGDVQLGEPEWLPNPTARSLKQLTIAATAGSLRV